MSWTDARNATSQDFPNDIYGALISSSGTIKQLAICTVTNSTGTADHSWSTIASDGHNYMVAWADSRKIYPC